MGEITVVYEFRHETQHVLQPIKSDGGAKQQLRGVYLRMAERAEELRPDVSSAVGLFSHKNKSISEQENARLERCLSDLVMCLIYPHLRQASGEILIEGPPLSKLIGRIGYRYPCPQITIGFVTIDEQFFTPPGAAPAVGSSWDGPFPELQEDSITRTFYHLGDPRLRFDLFAQGLGRFAPNTCEGQLALGVMAKLEASGEAVKRFARHLKARREESGERGIPADKAALLPFPEVDPRVALKARTAGLSHEESPFEGKTPGKAELRPAASSELTEEELFDAILGPRTSRTKHERFTEIVRFLGETGLGTLAVNIPFLRFLKAKIDDLRPANTWVCSQKELKAWFQEFNLSH